MKFRFTIARKLSVGFGILMIVVLANSFLTYSTLEENLKINRRIVKINNPSESAIHDLTFLITNSKMLIKNWVVTKQQGTSDKVRILELHNKDYPKVQKEIKNLVEEWSISDKIQYGKISKYIDTLFIEHNAIMTKLNSFESYDNLILKFDAESKVEETGKVSLLTDTILSQLNILANKQEKIVDDSNIQMEESFANFQELIFIMAVLLFIGIMITAITTTRVLVVPINYIKKLIVDMGKGILPDEKLKERSDEIGEMGKALNILINGLKKISGFAIKIGEGDFDSEFKPLSSNDVLGNSLILMRENLTKASTEAELRKVENNQRSWTSQGLAEFAEVLRESKDDIEEFSTIILNKLIRYLEASLGGLFILNEDEQNKTKYLELIAFYAYDRNKYINKRIEIGENLVGQCVQERETVYLTEIPEDYVHINSGLGNDNPKSLLIVPLIINEEVYGVVELASFNEFAPYQIEFVKRIGESIASAISNVKININTTKLLQESHEKSEILAKKEEEVRKNILSMEAAQKEILKREESQKEKYDDTINEYEQRIKKLENRHHLQNEELLLQKVSLQNNLNAINNSIGTLELSLSGEILLVNKKYVDMAEIESVDFVGRNLRDFTDNEIIDSKEFQKLWNELSIGIIHRGGHKYMFNEKEKWFYETFTPVKNAKGSFYKIIVLSNDISKIRENESIYEMKLKRAQEVIEKIKNKN